MTIIIIIIRLGYPLKKRGEVTALMAREFLPAFPFVHNDSLFFSSFVYVRLRVTFIHTIFVS